MTKDMNARPVIFTPEEVRNLHEFQSREDRHPFTCLNRDDGNHFHNGRDLGMLVPTRRGWICQCCDYTQGWAHHFMLMAQHTKGDVAAKRAVIRTGAE